MKLPSLLFSFCIICAPYVQAEPIESGSFHNQPTKAAANQSSNPIITPVVLTPQADSSLVEPLPKALEVTEPSNLPTDFQSSIKEANAGKVDAMIDVGVAYLDGTDFLDADENKAYYWFKKASDLNSNDGDYYIGMLAQRKRDYEQAGNWYRKCAEKGDAYCQYAMGYLFERGLGVEKDYKQARAWYYEAAEQE